jgi:hypothetical protein
VKEILERTLEDMAIRLIRIITGARYFQSGVLASCIVLPYVAYWPASCYKRIYIYSP